MRAKNPKPTTPPTLAESAIPPRADDVLMTPAAEVPVDGAAVEPAPAEVPAEAGDPAEPPVDAVPAPDAAEQITVADSPPVPRPPAVVEAEIRAEWNTPDRELIAIRLWREWREAETGARPSLADGHQMVTALMALPPQEVPVAVDEEEAVDGDTLSPRPVLTSLPRPAPLPVEPPAPRTVETVGTKIVDHTFRLTDEERMERGSQLARSTIQHAHLVAENKEAKRALKAKETAVESRIAELADIVRKGEEVRRVEVLIVHDFILGEIREVTDDGVTIGRRAMDPAARQTRLFPGLTVTPAGLAVVPGGRDEGSIVEPSLSDGPDGHQLTGEEDPDDDEEGDDEPEDDGDSE